MKQDKQTLEDIARKKIKKLDYPSYETFMDLNNITQTLIKEIERVKDFNDELKTILYICPKVLERAKKRGDIKVIEDYEVYTYSSLIGLSIALISLRKLYQSNGIEIKEKNTVSEEEIQSIVPKSAYNTIKDFVNKSSLGEAVSLAAVPIIEGIETELSKMPVYKKKYKKYASKALTESIKEHLERIKHYADLGLRLSDVLISLKSYTRGRLLKGTMDHFANCKDIFKLIKEEKTDEIYEELIETHAMLYKDIIRDDIEPFKHKRGEDISFAITLAMKTEEFDSIIKECKLSKGEPFMGSLGNDTLYVHENPGNLIKEEKRQSLAYLIAQGIKREGLIEDLIEGLKSPFNELNEKLYALGIGWKLAEEISDYLSINILERGITGKGIKAPEYYKILAKQKIGKDEYAIAIKKLVENIIGKKIKEFSLKYFNKNQIDVSNDISTWASVSKVRKNGKIKKIYEESPQKGIDETLDDLVKQFTNPKHEIFVRDNVGVCFVYNSAMGYMPKVDIRSLIEVQDDYEFIRKKDELSALFYKTEVMAHETTHVSQIGSRLLWRTFASAIVAIISDLVIEENKKGTLDYQDYHPKFAQPMLKKTNSKKTLRDELLEALKIYSKQALGKGDFAELCRQKGVYDALVIKEGSNAIIKGEINLDPLLETELEDSKASKMVKQTIDSIQQNDIKKLYRIREKAEEYAEELTSISETMAEAFGFTCTKDFIENSYLDLSKEKKEHYISSLKNKMIRKGKSGKVVSDMVYQFKKNPKSMEKKLNEKGFTYKRELSKYKHQRPVEEKLVELGYNPLDFFEAYEDMNELKRKLREHNKNSKEKWALKDLLYPMNNARALIDFRYNKQLPMFLGIIEKYGPQKAHDLMLNTQSINELEKLAK